MLGAQLAAAAGHTAPNAIVFMLRLLVKDLLVLVQPAWQDASNN
jgi:hypothetical protein